MRIIKKILPFLIITAFVFSFAVISSYAAVESKVIVNENYSGTGTGLTYAANATPGGQSEMFVKSGADGGGYAVFRPTLTGTNPAHAFVEINNPDLYFNSGDDIEYLIYDFDIATETQYPKKFYFEFAATASSGSGVFSSSASVLKDSSSSNPYISFGGATRFLESERGKWQHLSFVFDVSRNNSSGTGSEKTVLYIYCNGELVSSNAVFSKPFSYLRSMRISIGTGAAVDATDTICLDNVKVTHIGLGYDGNLASVLADSSKSLTEFDRTSFGDGYAFSKTAAIAKIGDIGYSTVSDIENALCEGDELVLLGDVLDTLNVPCGFSVYNPDGYKFNYDKGSYDAYTSDEVILFAKDYQPVTVTWHIGDSVVKETYSTPKLLDPPSYDEYGVFDGIQYKAMGFSRSEGGDVLPYLGFASASNCEFWLVYSAPSFYTVHKNGSKTFAYNDSELDNLFLNSVDGDTIVLMKDAVACSSNNAEAYKISSKAITVDLGGYALQMASTNSYDMFKIGAGGSITLKNGTIDMLDNGRIPQGSTSIARRRLFYIEAGSLGASAAAENLTINACKMIASIREGVLTLKDCVIDYTHDYENMIDLYSSNNVSAPPTVNLIGCDIKTYKTVVNTYKPNTITENISTVNIKDCNITTAEKIVSAETISKVTVDGGSYKCQAFFVKKNLNPNAVVEFSEGTKLSLNKIDDSGNVKVVYDGNLARCNDSEYPYLVTKNFAKITWNVLGEVVNENWVCGEMPVCPIKIPSDTREIKYEMPHITVADENKIYKLSVSPNFTLKTSVNLGMNLSLNVYIPEMNIKRLTVNTEDVDVSKLKTVLLDGLPYYKMTIDNGLPIDYEKRSKISVFVDSAVGEKRFDAEVSIPKYVDTVLLGGYGEPTYELALSMLLMMSKTTEAGEAIASMSATYNTDRLLQKIGETDSSVSGLSGVISSAELVTSGAVFVRLNLSSGYSGTIKVSASVGGNKTELEYIVKSGSYGGRGYIDIDCDVTSLIDGLEISADDKNGSFDIYSATLSATADNDAIRAIYAYARCASNYLEEKARG